MTQPPTPLEAKALADMRAWLARVLMNMAHQFASAAHEVNKR